MNKALKIEIKADTDEAINILLKHVLKEIVDTDYVDQEFELNSSIEANRWLVIDNKKIKGKYYWTKDTN